MYALETRQPYTIEYRVSKIVPQGHWDRIKSHVVLQGSVARRRISIPMCDQRTECNPHWHQVEHHKESASGYIWSHTEYSTATDRRWAMLHSNTPPVRNRVPLTTRSSSLRCASTAEHHTAERYSKSGRTKPESISQEVIYQGIVDWTSSRY